MATLRNKRKLAALNKENCEEHTLRSNLTQTSNAPRSQEHDITHFPEEIEDRVTKKLSKEFRRTESDILGALSLLDEFLNPLIQGHSGTAPETSRNTLGTNQGANEDDSQRHPHPEAIVSESQTTRNSGPDDNYDNVSLMLA